jgi:hypothetical protein
MGASRACIHVYLVVSYMEASRACMHSCVPGSIANGSKQSMHSCVPGSIVDGSEQSMHLCIPGSIAKGSEQPAQSLGNPMYIYIKHIYWIAFNLITIDACSFRVLRAHQLLQYCHPCTCKRKKANGRAIMCNFLGGTKERHMSYVYSNWGHFSGTCYYVSLIRMVEA